MIENKDRMKNFIWALIDDEPLTKKELDDVFNYIDELRLKLNQRWSEEK